MLGEETMKNVTAIGEILFDIYPDGKKVGGAPFNFIYHIIRLTGQGNFVSRIGKDDLGMEIRSYLEERGVSPEFVQTDQLHKTGIAKTTLNEKKIPDFIIEKNRAYDFIQSTPETDKLISENTDCLYYGTLAQRNEVSRNTIQNLFDKNVKCFCDLNIRQNYYSTELIEKSLKASNVLKLNEDELNLVNKLILNSEKDLKLITKKLIDDFEIELLCVTKGSDGAVLYRGGEENSFQLKNDKVVDTVGAGDAYASMLCIGYLENWNLERINKLASEFAGEIVKVEGALPNDDKIYETFKQKINDGKG